MIYFLKGKVEFLRNDSIILNVENVGYQVFVSHVSNYKINDVVQVFTYNVIKEDCSYLIGFPTIEEKTLFLSLIKVNGLGPKTAISALRVTTPEEFNKAVDCGNVSFLKKLPGISDRVAYQIILDLKGKVPSKSTEVDIKVYDEAKTALNNLGFKKSQIDKVLSSINEPNITVEQLVKLALQKLNK